MHLTEDEKQAIRKFFKSFGVKDWVIISLCILNCFFLISLGPASTIVSPPLMLAPQKDYSEELRACMIVVDKCDENSRVVDVQIKAIFEATKKELCK